MEPEWGWGYGRMEYCRYHSSTVILFTRTSFSLWRFLLRFQGDLHLCLRGIRYSGARATVTLIPPIILLEYCHSWGWREVGMRGGEGRMEREGRECSNFVSWIYISHNILRYFTIFHLILFIWITLLKITLFTYFVCSTSHHFWYANCTFHPRKSRLSYKKMDP